jgi:hypothetical protein
MIYFKVLFFFLEKKEPKIQGCTCFAKKWLSARSQPKPLPTVARGLLVAATDSHFS